MSLGKTLATKVSPKITKARLLVAGSLLALALSTGMTATSSANTMGGHDSWRNRDHVRCFVVRRDRDDRRWDWRRDRHDRTRIVCVVVNRHHHHHHDFDRRW